MLRRYLPHTDTSHTLIRNPYGQGVYLDRAFTQHIHNDSIETILEIGSRDAIDALELSDYYRTHVYAFECNPEALKTCYHNIGNNPNVTLVPLACWDTSDKIPFYPVTASVDTQLPINIGASSCLKINPDGIDHDSIQAQTMVTAVRLEHWMEQEKLDRIDLLCLDVQGATLQVLSGLGEHIKRTKYIITEGYHQPGYLGEALAAEIAAYLRANGFQYLCAVGDSQISNALFTRSDFF